METKRSYEVDTPKNCPFCGAKEITLNYHGVRMGGCVIWAECEVCGARSKAFYGKEYPDKDDNDWDTYACWKATMAWNRRDAG